MTTDPQTAADAAERVQRWLDAVREHGRRDTGYPDEDDVRALLADRARTAAELEQVRGEREGAEFRAEYATDLVYLLVSSAACRRDRFGNCLAHGEAVPAGGDCPHALARAFLAGAKAHRRSGTAATRPADATTGTGEGQRTRGAKNEPQRAAEGDGEVER